MRTATMPNMSLFRMRHFAHLTSPVEVTRQLPFAWKGDIVKAETIRDYIPGIYGFPSLEKRDKFVTMMNNHNDTKPCFAVLLQTL